MEGIYKSLLQTKSSVHLGTYLVADPAVAYKLYTEVNSKVGFGCACIPAFRFAKSAPYF